MSRLYASIDSDSRKTQATSRGHKFISTHTRGWTAGVQVDARPKPLDPEQDYFVVSATGGSGGGTSRELLEVQVTSAGDTIVTLSDWLFHALSAAYQSASMTAEAAL